MMLQNDQMMIMIGLIMIVMWISWYVYIVVVG